MENPPRYRYHDQGDRKHEITCYWPFSGHRQGPETKQQFASEMIDTTRASIQQEKFAIW
jgi:hypothetical protein